jgi:membrane protease YdiL (CAAX protease family)
MNKAIDYIGVFFRVLIAVLIFLVVQITVIEAFTFAGIDIKIYKGLFTAVYSIVCILAFVVYDKVRSYKREKLIRTDKVGAHKFIAAVVLAFGLLGIVTVYMYIATWLSAVFAPVAEHMEEYSDRMDRFSDVDTAIVPYWDSLIGFIASFMFVPLAEELTFRGAIFGEFMCKFNAIVSALLSSLVFALLHGISVQIGYALICGVIMALAYHYTGSIWITYIIHASFNLFGSALFTLLDSGIFGQMEVAANIAAFHASIIEVICIVPAAAAFILLYKDYKDAQKTATPIEAVAEPEVAV